MKKNIPFLKADVELAKLSESVPNGKNWLFEIKYDGYRILAFCTMGNVKLLTRGNKDYTNKFPNIVQELKLLCKQNSFIIDGEIIVLDKNGKSDFGALQKSITEIKNNFVYMAFDILSIQGKDLREKTLLKRKKELKAVLRNSTFVVFSDYVIGKGKESFAFAKKNGLEGIVCKKLDSIYSGTRNGDWLKVKCRKEQEFVIGGYETSEKNKILSAILVGYYCGKRFYFVGKVGTGFNKNTKKDLIDKFLKIGSKTSKFDNFCSKNDNIFYLLPKIVVQIQYAEITKSGNLRQASYKGIRIDKEAKDVVLAG